MIYHDDLEGIAAKKGETRRDSIFMVNSSGAILRFLPGKDGEKVAFQTFKTPLSARNDVEGLAYDPVTDCLLLACKDEASADYKNPLPVDQKAVYAFSLKTYKLLPKPRFLIPMLKITAATREKEFCPSSIERHPRTDEVRVAWVGDGNNVCHSLALGAAKLGISINIATPKGYGPAEGVAARVREIAASTGARVSITTNPVDGVRDAGAEQVVAENDGAQEAFDGIDDAVVRQAEAAYLIAEIAALGQIEETAVRKAEHADLRIDVAQVRDLEDLRDALEARRAASAEEALRRIQDDVHQSNRVRAGHPEVFHDGRFTQVHTYQ